MGEEELISVNRRRHIIRHYGLREVKPGRFEGDYEVLRLTDCHLSHWTPGREEK